MPDADAALTVVTDSGQRRLVHLDDYLDASAIEHAERAANQWIKALRTACVDGVPLRDRLTYRDDSLWWFAELYLHKERVIVSAHRAVAALEAIVSQERPAALAAGETPLLRVLVPQVAARHGLGVAGRARPLAGPPFALRAVARSWFHAGVAVADRLRPGARATRPCADAPAEVAAFVHTAFWRRDRGEEGYIGPVLRALAARVPAGGLALLGLGPRTNFRMRGWRHRLAEFNDPQARDLPLVPVESLATWTAIRPSLAVWRERNRTLRALEASPALRTASVVGGYNLWPIVRRELLGVTHLQLPWSARAMDEIGAALDRLRPRVVVTYAEAGGWGRALTLEARRRGIPVAGLQHGFIYRHWLNYLHEPDEMVPSAGRPQDRGFPRPDLTLLHDGFAERHLVDAGHFPPSSVLVTGSPRLESFVDAGRRLTADDRQRVRADAGAGPGRQLVVLATKFTQIGAWFRPLVEAVAAMPDAHLAVKCHPAEAATPYEAVAGAVPNVRVLPAGADLAALVASAELIVTVNSTAAIEAMSLDVPGLVLALPNNLSPFVEGGALAGVSHPGEIAAALRALLYDQKEREQLSSRRRAFVERYGIVSTGGAADRAADAIVALARRVR